tara:strand:- start:37476 stop:38024 length:549 start_codon:yes stop_codon:yes gene_type:complete
MKDHSEYLEFNGELILFVDVDGKFWISLPSLSKALKIDANRSYKNAKKDPIIGPALAIQPVQVPGKGGKQIRKVTCIPEHLVYGWLFSVNSDSPELLDYKKTCYKLLFDHFHGQIGDRKKLLEERNLLDGEIYHLTQNLRTLEEFNEWQKKKSQRKSLSTQLNFMDRKIAFEQSPQLNFGNS